MKKKSSKKEIEESIKSFRTLNEKRQKDDEGGKINKKIIFDFVKKTPLESYLAITLVIIMFFGYIWLYVYSSGK